MEYLVSQSDKVLTVTVMHVTVVTVTVMHLTVVTVTVVTVATVTVTVVTVTVVTVATVTVTVVTVTVVTVAVLINLWKCKWEFGKWVAFVMGGVITAWFCYYQSYTVFTKCILAIL